MKKMKNFVLEGSDEHNSQNTTTFWMFDDNGVKLSWKEETKVGHIDWIWKSVSRTHRKNPLILDWIVYHRLGFIQ